jgi:hypothetical protein
MNACFDFLYNFCLKRLSLNKIFCGRESRQCVKVPKRSMDWLRLYLQDITDGLGKVYHTMSSILKLGTESVHQTLEDVHTLTQLSAREDFFLLFCRRESFKIKHLSFSE